MRPSVRELGLAAALLLALALSAGAATPIVDGKLDAAYGPALVTQTTQTTTKNTLRVRDGSNGFEFDQGYGRISNGVLYLMLTGNMYLQPNLGDPGTFSSPIYLFFDTGAGGQNTLRSDNGGAGDYRLLLLMAGGLKFDADFVPGFWLGCVGDGGPDFGEPYHLLSFFAPLPANAGASATYLGWANVPGPDTLSAGGGSNPFGIAISLDNSNVAGVTQGCGAASGAGATTGFECAIPLAAIGNPTGPVKVCAIYDRTPFTGSNQVLGPLPPGTCALGALGTADLSAIAGNQYFVVNPSADAVAFTAATGVVLAASSSPGRGLAVRFTLHDTAPARLDVLDSGGRRVLVRELNGGAGGQRALELARPGVLSPGVYFLRLTQGATVARARAVVTR